MDTEMGIYLVLMTALLWMVVTFAILSAIDRPERKARRQERRENRTGSRRRKVEYRSAAPGSRPEPQDPHPRTRRLRPH
ncbi:hypothetical protein ACLH0K_08795 [Arthrobacter sp. MPF02]|uniref:hypothetical protein n=1 Tax=Arthrobacter sp. MPF02 TaxID=3388492 RepID=UPI003984F8F7